MPCISLFEFESPSVTSRLSVCNKEARDPPLAVPVEVTEPVLLGIPAGDVSFVSAAPVGRGVTPPEAVGAADLMVPLAGNPDSGGDGGGETGVVTMERGFPADGSSDVASWLEVVTGESFLTGDELAVGGLAVAVGAGGA